MFEKLTYSGEECNNYVYFSFESDYFDPAELTKLLGIQPTSVIIKKDPIPKITSWKYRINAGTEIDLDSYLEKIIDVFESKIEEINQLKEAYNLRTIIQFVIDIDVNPEASTPYFPLNNRVIDFLYKTGTTVDFDIYKAGSI